CRPTRRTAPRGLPKSTEERTARCLLLPRPCFHFPKGRLQGRGAAFAGKLHNAAFARQGLVVRSARLRSCEDIIRTPKRARLESCAPLCVALCAASQPKKHCAGCWAVPQ